MKDKILKLCRRLKKCTLDDLAQFVEIEKAVIETYLLYLEQENLIQINNDVITTTDNGYEGVCKLRSDLTL